MQLKIFFKNNKNPILNTGSTNRICPKCPGHVSAVSPHVAHFNFFL